MNFIGLDFNSRTHVLSPGWTAGVAPTAKLWDKTRDWLKDCLTTHTKCLKGYEGNKNIIFSHIPIVKDDINAFPSGELKCAGITSPILYKECISLHNEFNKIKEIIENNSDKILANFGGHIHGWSFPPISLPYLTEHFIDANKEYSPIDGISVITTEALMVSGNEKDLSNKGIIRIVKVYSLDDIDATSTIEGKFLALNPYISFDFKIFPGEILPCVFLKAHLFTKRDYILIWVLGDGNFGRGVIETHCYKKAGIYNIKLVGIDKETGEKEFITRRVEIKEGIIPRIIKVAEEKIELISTELGEKVSEFGRTMRDTILIKIKHSETVPVGLITVYFEQATEDIDLTELVADLDIEKKKSILYTPQWPEVIKKEKVLFIPIHK